MNYAVIKTGGKQYKVSQGHVLEVENLGLEPNEAVTFDQVLLVVDDEKIHIGDPIVKGYVVNGKLLENFRGEKIRVSKFKAKARFRRTTGHRQSLSKVEITSIGGSKSVKSAA